MTLVQNVSALACCMAQELKTRIDANHGGLAKAWVSFAYQGKGTGKSKLKAQPTPALVLLGTFNVRKVKRLGVGRYQIYFDAEMPDTHYGWHAQGQHAGLIPWVAATSTRITGTQLQQHMELRCTSPLGLAVDPLELHLTVWR